MNFRRFLTLALLFLGTVSNISAQVDTVFVDVNPLSGGTVVGAGEYARGSKVSLEATANTGYSFLNWTEEGIFVSADSSYSFEIDTNRTFTANFELNSYSISTTSNPAEGGNTSGDGIYAHGDSVYLDAIPNTGYNFVNWTESGLEVSADSSYEFEAIGDRALVANYELESYSISSVSNPSEGGTTVGDGNYFFGDSVKMIANPTIGYSFVNWTESGIEVSTDSIYSFTASSDRSLTANFSLNNYLIQTSSNPINGGVTTGGGSFDAGEEVVLTATPADGYSFGNWTENGLVVSSDSVYNFVVLSNRTLIANFLINQYSVKTVVSPAAGGNVTNDSSYEHGSMVYLNASPNKGWQFVNWSDGNTILSNDTNYSFVIFEDKDLTARFSKKIFSIDIEIEPEGSGYTTGAGNYHHDSLANLIAYPNYGWHFLNWTEDGEILSTDSILTFNVVENRSLKANFNKNLYRISTNASPEPGGYSTGDSIYIHGETVIINAYPDSISGYDFIKWVEGDQDISTEPEYSFVAESNRNLTAMFQLRSYNVELESSPEEGGSVEGIGRFIHGDSVTIKATPSAGWLFANWTDGEINVSSDTDYTFEITANRNLTANFAHEIYTVVSAAKPADAGFISGSGSFYYGQTAVLEPIANPGWEFENWTKDNVIISTDSVLIFTVTEDVQIEANYKIRYYSINCSTNPVEGGLTGGCGISLYDQEMIVEATANPGWKFVNWTENDEVVSSDPYYKFSVLGNRDLVANFELLTGLELETDEVLPDDYYISNAYPNPFNPSTNIKFGLPEASSVFVSIYNVNGQLVKNIYSDIILPGGNYTTSIKGDNLASGIYLYVFIANSQLSGKTFRKTEKLILLK